MCWWRHLTGALHVLQLQLSPSPPSSLAPIKLANRGSFGKMSVLKRRKRDDVYVRGTVQWCVVWSDRRREAVKLKNDAWEGNLSTTWYTHSARRTHQLDDWSLPDTALCLHSLASSCRYHHDNHHSIFIMLPYVLIGWGIKHWWSSSVRLSVRLSVCLSVCPVPNPKSHGCWKKSRKVTFIVEAL